MEKRTQEQIDQVDPNLKKLKNEIDLYLTTLNCFKENDPETLVWKFEAAKLINVLLGWYSFKIQEWTTQILNGVEAIEGFHPELINLINGLNMTPKPDKENTNEE